MPSTKSWRSRPQLILWSNARRVNRREVKVVVHHTVLPSRGAVLQEEGEPDLSKRAERTRRMGNSRFTRLARKPNCTSTEINARAQASSAYSFFFTRTTVIFAKPSSNAGAFNFAAMRRITSSGTTRSRR